AEGANRAYDLRREHRETRDVDFEPRRLHHMIDQALGPVVQRNTDPTVDQLRRLHRSPEGLGHACEPWSDPIRTGRSYRPREDLDPHRAGQAPIQPRQLDAPVDPWGADCTRRIEEVLQEPGSALGLARLREPVDTRRPRHDFDAR